MSSTQRYAGVSDDQLRTIRAACEEFEQALRNEEVIRIEDQIAAASHDLRSPLFRELLAIELELLDRGEGPSNTAEYHSRFPDRSDDIRQVFSEVTEPDLPEKIGRYRIQRILGSGGFGRVLLAHDDQLDRPVAIKVPHAALVSRSEDAERYLTEARTVANLDHPHIVPVHDVGTTDNCPCYIVSKFVTGTDLATLNKQSKLSFVAAAELVATIAEALHYAHKQGLVHRDVKPGNILVDAKNEPFLVDFGLALRDQDVGTGPRVAGTPYYMSPEQARGEGHRVDGRSDIYSLGSVFYELLVGRRPFSARSQEELLDRITTLEPKPPRQIDDGIPEELERICLKTLSKRASERYTTALGMAEDLRHFLKEHSTIVADSPTLATRVAVGPSSRIDSKAIGLDSDSQPIKIVPKGLRAFDEHDADFFLELLQGPRDRHGLPASLRFWKTRIEEADTDRAFSVGLIYGPSGCGKSSLVQAGLLPLLPASVVAVYVEATADDTEKRLLGGLRKRCRELPHDLDLKQTLAALRRGQGIPAGNKVLIVLDQFEQWLHANRETENTDLVRALRQCDGGRVQCIVMVRDDFWLAVSRFMLELEVDLAPGRNIGLADLFDLDHARKLLAAFGRAFARLPESRSERTTEQKEFLKQAVNGLAEDGKVVCVRLALFAEMMKGKPWTPATLKEVGGTHGVGVTFLEETFSARTANPKHRRHQEAARGVLKALLPESGPNIKGHMRSSDELLAASGLVRRSKEFDELIKILDSEIRLITPTDPEALEGDEGQSPNELDTAVGAPGSLSPQPQADQKYYQLTHDYLVPALREWLTRKLKETRRGRAELLLAERSALWASKSESRYLPSLLEWGKIRLLTDRKSWTGPQRQMMRKAGRVNLLRWGSGLVAALAMAIIVLQLVTSANLRALQGRTQTAVETMRNSRGVVIPLAIADLEDLPREMVLDELRANLDDATASQQPALAYALAHFGSADVDFLIAQIQAAPADEVNNIATALGHSKREALQALHAAAAANEAKEDWPLKVRLAIVALYLGDTRLAQDMCQLRPERVQRLHFILTLASWHGDVAKLARLGPTLRDPMLRSGICAGIGGVRSDEITAEAKQTWSPLLSDWYQNAPDKAVHSAAGWVLRQWNLKLPVISASSGPDEGLDWHVNRAGMTMLSIPAGSFARRYKVYSNSPQMPEFLKASLQRVTLTRSFLISDREVSDGQFRQLINDPDYPDSEKPTDWPGIRLETSRTLAHPVCRVNWNDTVLFCNWLSLKDGFTPCYVRTGKLWKIPAGQFTQWQLNPGADGYRLPTEAEWEYACRAGVTTQDPFGDEVNLLLFSAYATGQTPVISVYGRAFQPQVCGTKPPDGWGLFDLQGNVREWCQDWSQHLHGVVSEGEQAVTDPVGPAYDELRQLRRVLRHGFFFRTSAPISYRDDYLGFRVVRTAQPE